MNIEKFKPATIYILQNEYLKVYLMDYGATIVDIECRNKDNKWQSVVLGFDSLEAYKKDNQKLYLGATIGRNANRIKYGKYSINGRVYQGVINNGDNHLHGGIQGFNTKLFKCRVFEDRVVMECVSSDGEEGYPGQLKISVFYELKGNALMVGYEGYTDADTVCNLTNHSYFNLDGSATIYDHILTVKSKEYMTCDEQCMAKKLMEVDSVFDFNQPKSIGSIIHQNHSQLKNAQGLDHHFVLNKVKNQVVLYSPKSGIKLSIDTSQNGVQIYTANYFREEKGRNQESYCKGKGIAIEPQAIPNAINIDQSTLLSQGDVYSEQSIYRFNCIKN